MIRITALMDDKCSNNETLINEHGLSYFVEAGGKTILFDCGQSANTWHNAEALGLDAAHVDAVVLSHSHYDHAGGYRSLAELGQGGLLYTGDGFWEEKCSFDGSACQSRSAGFESGFLKNHGITHHTVTDVSEIAPGVYLVGNFPRLTDYETIQQKYVRKTETGFVWDDFRDEICMAIDVGGALAVLVGCAHPGIVNMITRVHEALDMPIRAIFGGTHLTQATKGRIDATLNALESMGLETLGFSHCSGTAAEAAVARNQTVWGCHLSVGDSVIL